jgi:CHAD domain-containing protein
MFIRPCSLFLSPYFSAIEPLDRSITLGECADRIIRYQFQKIVDQEEAVFKDKNPEPLHQMRVGMRRLSTAFQALSTAIVLPKTVNHRAIGKLSRCWEEPEI